MNRLERALSRLLNQSELTGRLAQVLAYASERGSVAYHEIGEIISGDAEDVLLLGNKWGLIFPVRTLKSVAWEDRLLLSEPGESYVLPNIVRNLVQNAIRTGYWSPMKAIAEAFKEIGEPAWQQMPELVAELGKRARDGQVSAVRIKKIFIRAGLGDRVDVLIAELKGIGVMSPKLGSLAEVSRATSPIYELNPSLFVKKGDTE